MSPPAPLYGKVKPAILADLMNRRRRMPTKSELRQKIKELYGAGISDTYIANMRAGRSVPWTLLTSLAACLGMAVTEIGDETDEKPSKVDPDESLWHPRDGWLGAVARLTGQFNLPHSAMCQDFADVQLAARIVMEWVGRNLTSGAREDSSLSKEEALARAADVMKRSEPEYAEWLYRCWDRARDGSIMFGVVEGENGLNRRVGVNVVFPLTKHAYMRIRSGDWEDKQLTPDDIELASDYLHINAACQVPVTEFPRRAQSSKAEFTTLMHQIVKISCSKKKRAIRPNIITFAGAPETAERLKDYCFREVGSVTPLTGKAIMEFARPALTISTLEAYGQYQAMRLLLQFYRVMIAACHRAKEYDAEN